MLLVKMNYYNVQKTSKSLLVPINCLKLLSCGGKLSFKATLCTSVTSFYGRHDMNRVSQECGIFNTRVSHINYGKSSMGKCGKFTRVSCCAKLCSVGWLARLRINSG